METILLYCCKSAGDPVQIQGIFPVISIINFFVVVCFVVNLGQLPNLKKNWKFKIKGFT